MPTPNADLSRKIQEARTASFGGEASVSRHSSFPDGIKTINFVDGEIDSIIVADCLLKRGMVVNISSPYTGRGTAVIISFSFGGTQLPVMVSMGGAEGELNACVDPGEIALLPKQRDMGNAVRLQAA